MITTADFIALDYTSDLTQAGVTYACKALTQAKQSPGEALPKWLRQITAGAAVELAFRRYLHRERVPHQNVDMTPFSAPDRQDIAIGGRRCQLKHFHLARKDQIQTVTRDPQPLLQAQALVSRDQMATDRFMDEDIFIFAFLCALVTPDSRTLKKALEAGQPVSLLSPLPAHWSRPDPWRSLGNLVLKSDFDQSIVLELGGWDADRAYQTEHIHLDPRERILVRRDFHTLNFIQAASLPLGVLGVHSPALGETHLFHPRDWANIWVYGMRIFLTGYLTRGEFRRRAAFLPAGSRVFQYARTRVDNLCLPVEDLHPLPDLFARAKSWKTS